MESASYLVCEAPCVSSLRGTLKGPCSSPVSGRLGGVEGPGKMTEGPVKWNREFDGCQSVFGLAVIFKV